MNGPRPVGRIVGLKMLEMPHRKWMRSFWAGLLATNQAACRAESSASVQTDGFRFVLLEEGTITLPPVLVVKERSICNRSHHMRVSGQVQGTSVPRGTAARMAPSRSEGSGGGRTVICQVFQEVSEVRHHRTLAFQS